MSDINELFRVHKLNALGMTRAEALARSFSELLAEVERVVPAGRELSIVRTHLQDACYSAKRGMAMQQENQE